MTNVAAIFACALLAGLAVFQLALIAGAPFGHFAWGGQTRVLPVRMRGASVIAIVLYGVFAAIIAQRAGLVAILPSLVADIGIWIVSGYLVLGVLANLASRSKPERFVMTPMAVLLCVSSFIVAFRV
jgi:hypothetical protein